MKTIEQICKDHFKSLEEGFPERERIEKLPAGVASIDNTTFEDPNLIAIRLKGPLNAFHFATVMQYHPHLVTAWDMKNIYLYARDGYFPGKELIKINKRQSKHPFITVTPEGKNYLDLLDRYLKNKNG